MIFSSGCPEGAEREREEVAMNIESVVAVVIGMMVLSVIAIAIWIWRRLSARLELVQASLGETEKRLAIEQELRQRERIDSEMRTKAGEAHLREITAATVEGAIERFKTVSNEQLKANGLEFAEVSRRHLSEIIEALQKRIKEYDERVDKVHQGNTALGTELKGYVQTIRDSAAKIHVETRGFREELKFNNKFQGDFGEDRLRLVLEHCGFVQGEDFVLQSGEDRKIPDCRVYDHLAKKILVIDSKMSWKNYSEGFSSSEPAVREAALQEHVKSVRKQIDNLACKRYHETLKPDREGYAYAPFTIMFVPSDGAMITAVEKDASLIQYAAEKNVYLTSPLNLFNLLKLLRTCLGNFDFAENLREIAKEAKNVVERIDAMFFDFEELGNELRKALQFHERVMKRLTDGSAENKSSIKESANKMIALSVKHDKLKSKSMKLGDEMTGA